MNSKKIIIRAKFSFPLQVKLFRDRAEDYKRLHPELDIDFDIPDNKLGTTEEMIRMLYKGKQEVDILDLHTNFEIPIVLKGNLQNLFVDLTDKVREIKEQFIGWEPCTWKNRIFAVPSFLSGSALYYRKDIFEQLGISVEDVSTWEDLIEVGIYIKKKIGAYLLALDVKSYNQIQPLMYHAGGGYFTNKGDLDVLNQHNIKALELYDSLIHEHKIALPTMDFYGPTTWDAYKSGKIVGAYMPEWYGSNEMLHNLKDMAGKFSIALAPSFYDGGWRSGSRGGMCACVVDGPNKAIAWDFLKFARLTEHSQAALLHKFYVAPSMLKVYDREDVKNFKHPFLANGNVTDVYKAIGKTINNFYVGKELLEVQKVVNEYLMPNLAAGNADVKALLGTAEDLVRSNPISMETALKVTEQSDLAKGGDVK